MASVPSGVVRAGGERSPTLSHPVVTLASWSSEWSGSVIGLVAGLAIGIAWHLVRERTALRARHASTRAGWRTRRRPSGSRRPSCAGRGRRAAAERPGGSRDGAGRGGGRARAARARRRPRRPRGPRRSAARLAGAFAELSAEALAKNNEQFLALADTKFKRGPHGQAQGDLSQRQQAIAQLLDPLSETLARYQRGLQEMELERKGAYDQPERDGWRRCTSGTSSCRRRPGTWSPRCARRRRGDAGARCSCVVWWRWPACSSTATSTSRCRPAPTTVGSGPT